MMLNLRKITKLMLMNLPKHYHEEQTTPPNYLGLHFPAYLIGMILQI